MIWKVTKPTESTESTESRIHINDMEESEVVSHFGESLLRAMREYEEGLSGESGGVESLGYIDVSYGGES